MASVKHGDDDIISNAEGGWNYTPGHKGNAREVRKLARARRARAAEMALDPAPHKLDVTFVGSEAAWASFRARLTMLYSKGSGTLRVPGEPDVFYTVFMGQPSISERRMVEDGVLYEIGMELMEL